MYGELGHKLVQHARRTQTLPHLPPYQPELVREVTRETRQLHRDTEDILAPYGDSFTPAADPPAAVSLLVDHLAMRRNKRCLLAYHKTRTDRLEEMMWRGEDVLESIAPASTENSASDMMNGASAVSAEDGSKSSLSPEEEEYVRKYEDLLGAVKGQWSDIDLSGSMEPPKDLFVDVRVLKDAGEIQTEYGSIMLTKNSQFYVRQGDVERLIQQGYLQKLG